ncbi:MAG: hypothetical protein GC134_09955 [Proteobacteria bacterium]|nr:hypothetical protein [Pseudomonadota bacterium]
MRLVAAQQRWEIGSGEHPALVNPNMDVLKSEQRRVFEDIRYDGPYSGLSVSPTGNIYGHNLATDVGYQALLPQLYPVCLSPLFVKDLAGRIVYTGLQATVGEKDWTANNRDVLFPKECRVVDENVQGAELLENVFLTSFRFLDMSEGFSGHPADDPYNAVAGFYEQPNLYPYKMRLDTFYIDGWRLPQTQMLFVQTDGVMSRGAEEAGADLMRRWAERPEGQSYEAFYESLGEVYFDGLFNKGCTLIPTVEACNGYNKVGRGFELEDYWPGRAVKGLHDIAERRTSDAPEGTILEVLSPGYALGHRIELAKVAVSDGAQYVSSNQQDADPRVIDIRLPHQRSSVKWGSCWLPTAPKHFEAPAIWGWEEDSGHFVQMRGPVWDPLHYYYASVDKVLASYENRLLPDNQWLVSVPEEMRLRFYPAVEMRGFDVADKDELERRRNDKINPLTMLKRFDDGKFSCDVGYHPLPLQFEYELDNWWFPALHPANRHIGELSFKLEDRVVPVVTPKTTPQEYTAVVNPPEEAPWIAAFEHMQVPRTVAVENYPQLYRYRGQLTLADIKSVSFIHLEYQYLDNVTATGQIEYDPRDFEQVENAFPTLYQQLRFMDAGAAERSALRQKLFVDHYDDYVMAWWSGAAPETLASLVGGEKDKRASLPRAATMGVGNV